MQDSLAVGTVVAIVSMVGTLLALSVIAGLIALLHRLLPESEPPAGEGSK